MTSTKPPESDNADKSFPIVAIGASAGGMPPLERFLSVLPKKFGFAVVFMQHLSPSHKSLLPELLRSKTKGLQIEEISDGLGVLPGKLYICPPAQEVKIEEGVFRTTSRSRPHMHLPIDEFLVSLSETLPERTIAVIFSGAGSDGARGVQAVRAKGGTAFVQDPATAEYPDMPLAAINTGQMDGVLSPEEIAREILTLHGSGMTALPADHLMTSAHFESLYRLVNERAGHRFNHYKPSVVARRVRRRMYLRGVSSVDAYLKLLAKNDQEASQLASDLLIGVTSFFRDRLAWKALHLEVTRKLSAEENDSPIRVWTPACATGEEAYSVAMMFQHELDLVGRKREIQIFATDVNDRALERAREGTYPATIAADLPPDYMEKFFTHGDDNLSVTVTKEIRQHVVFAKQDLLTDPPFSRLDLVICRNLLIYLEPDAQEKCVNLFHYALKSGGYLFLGNAESPGRGSTLFVSLAHKKCRIYRKGETSRPVRMPLAIPFAAERSVPKQKHAPEYRQSIAQFIQEALLEEHAPAAIAINQNHDILYHNGPTNRYLHQPRGTPTQNLLELIPQKLRNRMRGALYRAAQEAKPVTIRTRITTDEQKRELSIRISKLQDNLFLITFSEKGGLPEKPEVSFDAAAIEETAVRQLENELSATRDDLQSHIEQLKSLNEELESSNEELQAANEELETSREELQSLNEELTTVNTQLQTTIEEQEETNNDLNNFFTSTSIPTIFLDQRFRVKRFTPAMTHLITLIPADAGRPIIDMSHENLGPDLIADAQSVLNNLTPVKKELPINGGWYVRTTLPYRTSDNHIEGVVITYMDITERKRAEEELRKVSERERFLARVLESADTPFGVGAPDGSMVLFNRAFAELIGYTREEMEEKGVSWVEDLTPPEWREREAATLGHLERTRQPVRYEKEYIRKGGTRVPVELFVQAEFDDEGRVIHYFSFLTDITERKRAEEQTQHLASYPLLNPNPVLEVDSSGKIIFVNPATYKVLEVAGLGEEDVTAFLPADLNAVLGAWDGRTDVMLNREVIIKDEVFEEAIQLVPQFKVARIYGRNITKRKQAEEALQESEQRVRNKLEAILAPEGDIGNLELADIIDVEAVQSLMDEFHALAPIPMAIIDMKGKVLVGQGWQDICTKYHRANPEACKHCIESDLELSAGVPPGESKLYKCKNNMWDIATPVIIGGEQMGNVFSGQFFFDGEPIDYELFRSQARRYGFDEEEYIAALEAVPRLTTETVDRGMAFLTKLAHMLSQLSYSNIKLARSLGERDTLMDSLRESEQRFRALFENAMDGIIVTDPSGSGHVLSANLAASEMFGYDQDEFLNLKRENMFETADSGFRNMLEERDLSGKATASLTGVRKDGTHFTADLSTRYFEDRTGRPLAVTIMRDVTERKLAEEKLHQSEERYRTLFDSLLEGFCIIEVVFDADNKPVDYRFLAVNPMFEKQTGLHKAQGRLMRELAPDHETRWFEVYGKVALTGEPERFVNEARALNCWYDVSAYRIGGQDSRKVAILFNDITEAKRAEDEIRRYVEELRAGNEELTRLNRAMVGRELRMIDLKKEVNELCVQASQPPRYPLEFEKEQP